MATWTPLVEDALLFVEDKQIASGSTVSSSDLRRNVCFVLLASPDRKWKVNIGDAHSSFLGPARVSLNHLVSDHTGNDSGRRVALNVLLEGRSIAEWTLDLTPSIVALECCWKREETSGSCFLNMQGAWFGFRGLAPRLVLYVDDHRIQEFHVGDGQEGVGPAERRFAVQFPVVDTQIGFYRDAGKIYLEAVFGEYVLERVSIEPCPVTPLLPAPEQLRQAIRAILRQAHEPETNEDACYEQALYLSEQYVAQTGQMPFAADDLCAQLGMSPTSDAVRTGLLLIEALVSQQVLMTALPTPNVGGRCGLVVLTLRVFYEVFLYSRGLGMPASLAEYISQLVRIGDNIENVRLKSWGASVAAYGKVTLSGKDVLPTTAECDARTEALRDPVVKFHAPFIAWLKQ